MQQELTLAFLSVSLYLLKYLLSFRQKLHVFLDFDLWISLNVFVQKLWLYNFFSLLALLALRQQRVHSNLLDGTAFEALPLIVCTRQGSDVIADPTST